MKNRLEKCKINLIKQIKSLDKLKTDGSLSQISSKMITANVARAWNSCDVFNGLVIVCSFTGKAGVTLCWYSERPLKCADNAVVSE